MTILFYVIFGVIGFLYFFCWVFTDTFEYLEEKLGWGQWPVFLVSLFLALLFGIAGAVTATW